MKNVPRVATLAPLIYISLPTSCALMKYITILVSRVSHKITIMSR